MAHVEISIRVRRPVMQYELLPVVVLGQSPVDSLFVPKRLELRLSLRCVRALGAGRGQIEDRPRVGRGGVQGTRGSVNGYT